MTYNTTHLFWFQSTGHSHLHDLWHNSPILIPVNWPLSSTRPTTQLTYSDTSQLATVIYMTYDTAHLFWYQSTGPCHLHDLRHSSPILIPVNWPLSSTRPTTQLTYSDSSQLATVIYTTYNTTHLFWFQSTGHCHLHDQQHNSPILIPVNWPLSSTRPTTQPPPLQIREEIPVIN
jgi:hypothetical protein